MEEIKIIKTTELLGKQLTVYGTPDEPLFRARDVADMIEHPNITKMLSMIDDDEKGVNHLLTPGGYQTVRVVTEDGLYEILMLSRKPIAKEFKKGVKKILKEIRLTGQYRTRPMTEAEALLQSVQMLVDLERKQKQLEERTDTIGKDVDDIKDRLNNELKSYTVVGYCARNNIDVSRKEASAVGNRASRLCKKKGIHVDTMSDPRFGKVNLYPEDILKELVDNMVAARQAELVM